MVRISDPEIRRRLFETLKRVQKLDGFGHARLIDMDCVLSHARLARTDARVDCGKHLLPLLSAAYAHLAVLSALTLGMIIQDEEPLPADWLGQTSLPDCNFILRSNLTQLTNHSLSVLSLIERGFANSARSLLRTLIEAVWVTIVFCGNKDKAQQYTCATDFDKAKDIWQKYFSPRSMMACLSDIERHLGLDADIVEYLHEHRKRIYQLHTQSAHNTYSVLAILSFDSNLDDSKEEPSLYPALHGRVGLGVKSTLEDTIDVLGYAVLMLFVIFQVLHNHKPAGRESFWAQGQTFAIGSLGLWFGTKHFKSFGKIWGED